MARIESPSAAGRPRAALRLSRVFALVGIAFLAAIVASQGRTLYQSFLLLREEEVSARANAVVGYIDVNPLPSYAERPGNWLHDDGEHSMLWAGWRDGQHVWFRVGRGDLSRGDLRPHFGIDAIRAIDHPIVEEGGGERWDRIPGEALVAGVELGGDHAVYPIRLLSNVEVVNDRIASTPVLVAFRPFSREMDAVAIFEATLGGRRITMGLSGYFHGPGHDLKPLLYDRGTRSLWVERDGLLVSVAGPHKGAELRQLGRLEILPWQDWRSRHPRSRLIVGADRSKPCPDL